MEGLGWCLDSDVEAGNFLTDLVNYCNIHTELAIYEELYTLSLSLSGLKQMSAGVGFANLGIKLGNVFFSGIPS